jgi:putative intracellular protease/amidase
MKKIFTICSNYGYWGVELSGPMAKLEQAGYTLVLATPKGERPVALPPSYDIDFFDAPLGRKVNTAFDVDQVNALRNSDKLDNPLNLSDFMPQRPYYSNENVERNWDQYFEDLKKSEKELALFDGLMIVGGSGPILDVVNNQRVHDVICAFYKMNKPVGAICYGVASLVFARDLNDRAPIIRDKHVTGHCLEYDYMDGTGFAGTDFNMGPPPYVLEYMLRDAVGEKGKFHGNFGKPTSVIVDYPFITARSLQCSHEFGEKFVEVLDNGLKRYGW